MPFLEKTIDGLHVELLDITHPWIHSPQTLIFHHGVGANPDIWSKWLSVLAPDYRIIRFDMRGFGRSAGGARPGCWTMLQLAKDVISIADEFGLEKLHFVGESIGGTIGLFLALAHPERVHSLTLSNAAYRGGAIQNVSAWHQVLSEQGTVAWSRDMMRARFYEDGISEDEWRWFETQQASHPIESIVQARNILVDSDLGQDLPGIKVPVLLLHGDSSPFVPVEQMVEMSRLLPSSELNIFGHARHGLPFSHGKQCAERLRVFLQRHF